MSETPSRGYQRSTPGLVGAMIVVVACVLAFVAWRAIFRGDAAPETAPVEWERSVELADSAGIPVVRPERLPEGWTATSANLETRDDPTWSLGLLTDEGRFVGLRQEDASVAELVRTYVDEEAVAGEDAAVDSAVSRTWQTWSDDGGDLGYSAEVGEDTVLVYGSAGPEDIEELIGLLTLP